MILTVTAFFFLAVSVHAKNTYLITAPRRITLGRPYRVNVNILNATEAVNVEISILRSWYNNTQYVKIPLKTVSGLFKQGEPGILELTVPRVTTTGSYILRAHAEGGLAFEREETLIQATKTVSVFIQTDKAVYKPGQRVHFRIFTVYPDLQIYSGPIDVDIFDPNGNRIYRAMSVLGQGGVVERDMLLSDQPVLGQWSIVVVLQDFETMKQTIKFKVEQYELPKFEVKVELPPFALVNDENLSGTIKANYTFGKGVKGYAEVRVYVGPVWTRCGSLSRSVHKAFPIDGSEQFSVPVSEIRKLQSYLNQQRITVVADVKEELTGKTLNGSSKVTFYERPYKIAFMESSPNTFKPGLPYTAYLKVTQQDGRPVTDDNPRVDVFTCVRYEKTEAQQSRYECHTFSGTYSLPVLTLAVPPDGVIPVAVDIPDNTTQVNMRAYYKEAQASLAVSKGQSASDTYIQASLMTADVKAGETAKFMIQATIPPGRIHYQISSRGTLVTSGEVVVKESKSHMLPIDITATMSPTASFLVYFVKTDGEIVADSISFNVDGVFENKVSIGFENDMATPHSAASVKVKADIGSAVYLLAVDQSVLLLESGNDITTDKVMKELRSYDSSTSSYDFATWRFPVPSSGQNAQQIFQRANVLVITDARLYSGYQRRQYHTRDGGFKYGMPGMAGMPGRPAEASMVSYDMERGLGSAPPDQPSLKEVERTREIFPETWLWINKTIRSEEGETIQMTVPDTITSWIASAFAISQTSGLGVAPTTAKLKVFRSFFVSLNLPVSVVRGEQVVLQANVFNYLGSDQKVRVKLEKGSFKSILIVGGSEETTSDAQIQVVDVPAGEAKAVYFPIVPTSLGSVDIEVSARTASAADGVRRQLTVKAEGFRKELNVPFAVDLTGKKKDPVNQKIDISTPPDMVEGSERIRMSVTGDLLGPTMDGLENLLILPTGCGEQNMLRFAPNIYVADYLMATKQMTLKLEDKIKTYLQLGYQRQLSYQRWDGSFSTFGNRDEAGSVWLTSFVLKAFYQARRYIYVDNATIDSALDWLLRKQNREGVFIEPGRVVDKQMQGPNGASPQLSAYVLLSLAELTGHNGSRVNATRLEEAKAKTAMYLGSLNFEAMDRYPLAITSYALWRANSFNSGAFSQLKKKTRALGKYSPMVFKYGKKEKKKPKQKVKKVTSTDILAVSYTLMTFVSRKKFSPALPFVHWLTSKRSPRGGFISSQDTSVALEALTMYLSAASPDSYDMNLEITAGDITKSVNINNENVRVLQNIDLPAIPSQLQVSATGQGMALVELGVFYNVLSESSDSDVFDVSVVLLDDTINGFTLMTCAKHLGEGSNGMCLATIQIPSGFTADLSSVGNIAGLKRLEQNDQTVTAYFDEIGKISTCMTISCTRTSMVTKNREACIQVVDYYDPEKHKILCYQPRRLKDSNVCQVCRGCDGCEAK